MKIHTKDADGMGVALAVTTLMLVIAFSAFVALMQELMGNMHTLN
jgi:hypothetical protein